MLPGKTYTPDDLLRVLRKRWWIALFPAALGLVGATLYSFTLPNRYRAETLIMVTPQQIPESYIRSFGGQKIEDRLAALQQQILSRTRLERVISDFNLYPEQRRQMPMEDVVERMRKDIDARAVRGDVFALQYVSVNARSAKEVTERLASMFIDENLRNRMATADSTSQFLQAQLADTRRKLEEIETQRAQFRQKYMGELPEQVTSNLAVLNSTQVRAQSLTDANAADLIRKAGIERQIAELTLPGVVPGESGGAIDYSAGSLASVSSTAGQLAQAQEALAQLRQRLREDHPDVKRGQRTIEDLQLKLDRETAERPISPRVPRSTPGATPDPRALRVVELRQELEAVKATIANRQRELAHLSGVMGQYQSRMQSSPALQNELMQIERNYATYRKQYDDLLAKANNAEMSAGVEQRQIGEQFRILDAARMPERAFSPNRQQIVGMGLLGGLAVGVALIGLLEFRDSSFHTPDDVLSVLALPVVAAIPIIHTQSERRAARRRRFAMSFATAVVLLVGVTFIFVRYGL
jgi:polysaccharide chain length determinant protein (PEP-CTERM system associated)